MFFTLALSAALAASPDPLLSLEPAIVAVLPRDPALREYAGIPYDRSLRSLLQPLNADPLPGLGDGTWTLALGGFRDAGQHVVSLSQLRLPAKNAGVLSRSVLSALSEGRTVKLEGCGQGCTLALLEQDGRTWQGLALQEEGSSLRVVYAQSAIDLKSSWLLEQIQAPPLAPWSPALEQLLRPDTEHGLYVQADRLQSMAVLYDALRADQAILHADPSTQERLWLAAMDEELMSALSLFPHDLELGAYSLRVGPDGLQFVGELTALGLALRPTTRPQRVPMVPPPDTVSVRFVGDSSSALRSAELGPELLKLMVEQRQLTHKQCAPECDLLLLARPWAMLSVLASDLNTPLRPVDGLRAFSMSLALESGPIKGEAGWMSFEDPAQASAAASQWRPGGHGLRPVADGRVLWLAPEGGSLGWGRARPRPPGLSLHIAANHPGLNLSDLFFPAGEEVNLQSQVFEGLLLFQGQDLAPPALSMPAPAQPRLDPDVQSCQLELASVLGKTSLISLNPHTLPSARASILEQGQPLLERCEALSLKDPVLDLMVRDLYGIMAQEALFHLDMPVALQAAQEACGTGGAFYCDWGTWLPQHAPSRSSLPQLENKGGSDPKGPLFTLRGDTLWMPGGRSCAPGQGQCVLSPPARPQVDEARLLVPGDQPLSSLQPALKALGAAGYTSLWLGAVTGPGELLWFELGLGAPERGDLPVMLGAGGAFVPGKKPLPLDEALPKFRASQASERLVLGAADGRVQELLRLLQDLEEEELQAVWALPE